MEDTSKSNSQLQPEEINPNTDPNMPEEYIVNKDNPEDLDIKWTRWKCLKCGYVYEGVKELKKCPKCGNEDPDFFADVD